MRSVLEGFNGTSTQNDSEATFDHGQTEKNY